MWGFVGQCNTFCCYVIRRLMVRSVSCCSRLEDLNGLLLVVSQCSGEAA